MGFLDDGTPLAWKDSITFLKYVREHGVKQFISTYKKVKDRKNDKLLWGDEIEYMILKFDHSKKKVYIALRAKEVIGTLEAQERELEKLGKSTTAWRPEYGNWMVEAVPRKPYGGQTSDLCTVVQNMHERRDRIESVLLDDECAMTIVAFPTLGVGQFTFPFTKPGGIYAQSDCVSDKVINPHPRFWTLTGNIRERRGSKVDIRVPVYSGGSLKRRELGKSKVKDDDTLMFKFNDEANGVEKQMLGRKDAQANDTKVDSITSSNTNNVQKTATSAQREYVTMDCMAFGMGCCCLQVTFQARDLTESLRLYDQLAVLAPILLALGAACPILKGRLVDTDVRWNVISASVDDRTELERGVGKSRGGTVSGPGNKRIKKSRYDSIDSFISNNKYFRKEYNDIPLEVDGETFTELEKAGIPHLLANHIAHLFIRDPLVIYKERVEIDDSKDVDHFENIQSTNWQSVRWKPPPPSAKDSPDIGWRVEFRSTEVQLTEFENAAFSVFIALSSRVILFFDLNMYMPMSKVDENMSRAHKRGAVLEEKFYFRNHVVPLAEECGDSSRSFSDEEEHCCTPMTIRDILMGKQVAGGRFPGLVPLIYAYLDIIECDISVRMKIETYCDFLGMRASGKLLTTASWMRNFVLNHPLYNHDSVVTDEIAYDLLIKCKDLVSGKTVAPELFGEFTQQIQKNNRMYADSSKDGGKDVLLRGSSFRREVQTGWQCNLIKQLINKYSNDLQQHTLTAEKNTFKKAMAYLKTE